jgi:hypothetical protein
VISLRRVRFSFSRARSGSLQCAGNSHYCPVCRSGLIRFPCRSLVPSAVAVEIFPSPSFLSRAGVRCHPVLCSGFVSVLPGSGECVRWCKPVCNQVACSLPSFFECLLVLSAQDLNSHRAAVVWTGLLPEITSSCFNPVLFLSRWYKGLSFS